MLQSLSKLQEGSCCPHTFRKQEANRRALNLQLSTTADVQHNFTAAVNSLDIENCESRYLLSGCSDGSLHIHDLFNFSGQVAYTAPIVSQIAAKSKYAHANSVECVSWYPSDNRMFLTSGADKQLKLWDTNDMKPLETFPSQGRISHHQCSWSSRAIVAVASQYSYVELVDLRTGHASHELRGHKGPLLAVAWSPRESCLLASSSRDGHALMWDVRSGSGPLCSLNSESTAGDSAHKGQINGLAFTPDGLHLLTLGMDRQLRLWNTTSGQLLPVNYGRIKNDSMRHVQISVGSGTVFLPSKGWVRLFSLMTGDSIGDLCGHANRVNCCMYRQAYHELYSGGSDRNVLVWTTQHDERETDKSAAVDQWSSDESDI